MASKKLQVCLEFKKLIAKKKARAFREGEQRGRSLSPPSVPPIPQRGTKRVKNYRKWKGIIYNDEKIDEISLITFFHQDYVPAQSFLCTTLPQSLCLLDAPLYFFLKQTPLSELRSLLLLAKTCQLLLLYIQLW